jgi:hypothetical protein
MANLNDPTLNIQEYKDRVINHFKTNPSEQDWKLLGVLFLNASENEYDDLNDFDKQILTKTEYQNLYEQDGT